MLSELIAAKLNGGGGGGGGGTDSNAVHYSPDSKTDAQRANALANVGGEPQIYVVNFTESSGSFTADKTYAAAKYAYTEGAKVAFFVGGWYFGFATSRDSALRASYFVESTSTMHTLVYDGNGISYMATKLAEAENNVTVSGSTPTISAAANAKYLCGELTSLTVDTVPASGMFEILFVSGSTATVVTLPQNVLLPDDFDFEAGTIYEMSVEMFTVGQDTYGLAAVQGWSLPTP